MVAREEVVWAYRLLLGREPENEAAIALHSGYPDRETLRRVFFNSLEFNGASKALLTTHQLGGYWVATPVLNQQYLMWIDLADRHVSIGCLLDDYETEGTQFMRSVLKPGDVVVDAGANLGWFTLVASSIVGDKGHVHAFEPRPDTAHYLEKTIALNRLGRRVSVYRCGLSDSERLGLLAWWPEGDNRGGTFLAENGTAPGMASRPISLRPLDDLALPRLDFLKVDVEGAEILLFRGARRTLERCRPVILSELYPEALVGVSGVTAEAYFDFFAELGYRCFIVDRHRCGEELHAFPADWPVGLMNVALVPNGQDLARLAAERQVSTRAANGGRWLNAIPAALRSVRSRRRMVRFSRT